MDSPVGWNFLFWLLWLLLLISFSPDKSVSSAAVVGDLWSPKDSLAHHDNKVALATMPSFDVSLPLNVTTQYGAHAHLVCRVQDVANKSVSWVRKKDGHLLAVDTDTFIADGRFQVHHPANSDTWTLHLRGARGSDVGKYECQVSSEPKLSLVYQLNVVVPQVEIRGAPDIYVMAGSGVALHCVISGLIETPPYVFWYHKTERIAGSALEDTRSFEGSREAATPASFSGATKNGWSARVTRLGPDSLLAVLNVPPATPDFAGNYSCGPPSLQLASATLHVLNGEQPAAMQHGKNAAGFVGRSANWRNTVFVTLFLMMAARVMSSTATTTTVSQKEREGQQQQQLDGDERHGRDEEKEEQVEEEDDDKEKEANGHGKAKGSVLAVDRVIVDHETEAAAIAVVVVPIVESVCGSTSTPNRSTDRTAAPISIGGKEMPTWSDVPPRCRMTTHSARSS